MNKLNSNDIYAVVGKMMGERSSYGPIINKPQEIIDAFKKSITEYTEEKLISVGEDSDQELSDMFERLDIYFESIEQKDAFYDNYIYCQLNIINDITKGQITWSPLSKITNGKEYPNFTSNAFSIHLETDKNIMSSKDTALLLYEQISTNFEKEVPVYIKDEPVYVKK